MSKLSIMAAYSRSFIGLPYKWGGSHPSEGYDCSGFIQELLASVGMDPPGDQTAQSLYNILSKEYEIAPPSLGVILFFGKSVQNISHVALALDELHMIEAGGGNSTTVDKETAIKQNAFIRVRPISRRRDLVASILPRY